MQRKRIDDFSHETCSDLTWMCHWSSTAGGRERREANADCEQQFLKLLQCSEQLHWTKKLQKYIWSPDQLPLCWAFSDMLHKLCAFKAVRPIQPSGYGEVCSLHIHFIDTKYQQARWRAQVHSSHIHTHITRIHNQDFSSSSCEIKGRASVWHNIYVLRGFWTRKYSSHYVTKYMQDLNCTGLEKAAAALLLFGSTCPKKLTTDV